MLCKYYYTVPTKIVNPLYAMWCFKPDCCPGFSPIAADYCRFCQTRLIHHKKYYIYSHYTRKIQLKWFEYKFRCFTKHVHNKYHMLIHNEIVLLSIFRKKYYRKWDVFYWEVFLKSFQGNAFKK